MDVEGLQSTHEADTRLILHCAHTQSCTVVVWSQDTDVLILLIAHFCSINKEIHMDGTSKKTKFLCISGIINTLNLQSEKNTWSTRISCNNRM